MRVTSIGLLAALALGSTVPAQLTARVYTTDRIIRVRLPRGEWFAPEQVQRIEVETRGTAGGDLLEAWIDKQAWPFSLDPQKRVQVVQVDERMRKAWTDHGVLTIGFATQRNTGGELVLRAGLRRLELPAEGVRITLEQRETTSVPGSEGYLRLHIDDITGGQVRLDVRGADGRTLIAQRSVKDGDHLTLPLGDEEYLLVVNRLVNILIGDDHGVFTLYEREPYERRQIEALLVHVAGAEMVFVREGTEYDGQEAAAHLRRKYAAVHDKVHTLDQFIAEIGGRSSTSGNEYLVRLPDGAVQSAGTWLRQQAKLLQQKESEEKGTGKGVP